MILQGDCRELLKTGPDESVQCCVTSPPYWGLRDYGVKGQIGLEKTPEEYVANLVEVFREVRRVLRPDGTLWLNLGDSYARSLEKGGSGPNGKHDTIPAYADARRLMRESEGSSDGGVGRAARAPIGNGCSNLKPKDLVGIPWMVALALRADGWYLRSDIIWAKNNPMPESVRDRPTKAHEYVFLLSKSERYFYDHEAIKEDAAGAGSKRPSMKKGSFQAKGEPLPGRLPFRAVTEKRNARSVWTINTKPFKEAHFAVFPEELARRCILAGSKPGDTVLDPFHGAGTTGLVAQQLEREYVGIELSAEYVAISKRRGVR